MTLEKLKVIIGADISNLKSQMKNAKSEMKGMSSDFKKSTSKITNGFEKAGKTIAAVFGIKALSNFGKKCAEIASDLTEVQNVVDTVFGSMSNEINNWSKNAKTQFGISELSAKKYSSTMGAMLKSMGLSGESMKTMSLNLSALAADMASFYNLPNDMAFDKIRAGISGETEPLKQLGINMSVANLEAYALSKGITKSYQAMSQSEQAILRYNYLLSVTKDAQGDFKRTSESWANQSKILKETISQLKGNIGALIIQALTPLLQSLNKIVSKMAEVSSAIKNVFGIKDEAEQSSSSLSDTAENAGTIGDNLHQATDEAKKLKNAVMGFDELNILSVDSETNSDNSSGGMNIDNPYAGAFDGITEKIDGIDKATQGMLDKVIPKLRPIADSVKLIKDTWVNAWEGGNGKQIISEFKGYLSSLLDTIHNVGEAFQQAWNEDSTGTDFINSVQDGLKNVIQLAKAVQESIAVAFVSSSGVEFIKSIIKYFEMLIDLVGDFAEGLQKAWNTDNTGNEFIQSLMDGFSAVLESITLIGESISNTFKNEYGQAMFSSLISMGGEFLGVVEAIADSFKAAWEENSIGQGILNKIADTVRLIADGAKNLAQNFRKAWESNEIGKQIFQVILETIDHVVEKAKEAANAFKEWSKDVDFAPLLESIKTLLEAFERLASIIADKLAAVFEDVLLPLAGWTIEAGLPELINAFASALEWVASVLEKIPPDKLAAMAAGFIAVKLAVSGFSSAVSGLIALGTVATSIQSIISVFQLFSSSATMAKEAVVTAADSVVTAGASFTSVGTAIAGISAAALLVTPVIADFEGSWSRLKETLNNGLETIKQLPEYIENIFSSDNQYKTLSDFMPFLVDMEPLEQFKENLRNTFESLKDVFSSNNQYQTLSDFMPFLTDTGAFEQFKTAAVSAFEGITSQAQGIVPSIASVFQSAATTASTAFSSITQPITSIFSGLSEAAQPMIDSLSGSFNKISGTAQSVFSTMSGKITAAFSNVASSIGSIVDSVIAPIQSLAQKVENILDSLFSKAKNISGVVEQTNSSAASLNTASSSISAQSAKAAYSVSMPSLPELAGGGVLKKATAVVAGEYPGAMSNPEIVAPQKIIQQIISKANESMATDIVSGIAGIITQTQGGTDSRELSAKISGDDLLFLIKNAEQRKGTIISENFAFGGL